MAYWSFRTFEVDANSNNYYQIKKIEHCVVLRNSLDNFLVSHVRNTFLSKKFEFLIFCLSNVHITKVHALIPKCNYFFWSFNVITNNLGTTKFVRYLSFQIWEINNNNHLQLSNKERLYLLPAKKLLKATLHPLISFFKVIMGLV